MFNLQVIALGVISIAIGAWIQHYSTQRNNAKLIAAFKAELEAYNQAKGRASGEERVSIDQQEQILQAKINLLENLD